MKKLLFLLLMLIPITVKANTNYYIAIQDNEDVTYYPFESQFKDWVYSFEISPFDSFELKDANYINNLAYLSYFDSTEIFQVTIQNLIWQHIHPEYSFYIVDSNYQKIDNSEQLKRINQIFDTLTLDAEFMNQTYELNPNEELTIKSPASLKSYEINSDILKNNNTISLNFNLIGTYIIKFSNKDLDITDNIISGHEFFNEPFQITVNVDDYYNVCINTYQDDELIDSNILIYDIKGNLVKHVTEQENIIRLKNQQYKFVDKLTKEEKVLIIDENTKEITFNHYNINGIKTNMNITKICQEEKCFSFTKENDLYIFDTPLLNGYYDIYSNNKKYTYDFNNQTNYIENSENGLLYFIEYNEDIKDEPDIIEPVPPIEIEDDSEINIAIPDTEITLTFKSEHIAIIKKKEFELI